MNKRISVTDKFGPLDEYNKELENNSLFIFPLELKWNGEYLGEMNKSNILSEFSSNGKNIWTLNFIDRNVMYITAISLLPCINDEILELFGFYKMGTHCVKYGNKLYILYKLEERDVLLEDNTNLVTNSCRNNIQKIIAMKSKLGWSKFEEFHIMLRWIPTLNDYVPIPLHENTVGNFKLHITQKLYLKWTGNQDNIDDIIFRNVLLSIKDKTGEVKSLIGNCFQLIGKIELCITRIEPELIYIINDIKKNIMKEC